MVPPARSSIRWRGRFSGAQASISIHGTGHGVGSHLRPRGTGAHLQARRGAAAAGMIISNEPGYYKAGEYGIRIEFGAGDRGARCARRGEAAERLRDLTLASSTGVPIATET